MRTMEKGKAHLYLCVLSVCLSLFTSCESFNCPLNNTVASVYNFYAAERTDNGTFVEGAAVSISDTITISAIDLDSVIANRLHDVGTVSLPMSFYNAADSLLWSYTDSKGRQAHDTIIVHKTNIHHFDDPSCPIHIWHHIDSIHFSRNIIDTIIVANADVNYDGLENFKIYFRVSSKDEDEDE